ncbi:hypothetical protein DFJ69_4601 [Thermomonospora umbrina]|uniref:Uncharacterized protein n=1 Tax=Thermomonospora umbrina TaxID=111806 RepID=A0A3D9SSZ4_9ACTN|nr:hypothetical protein DFJ69_4601 [Thermomonospora umbrina]
MHRSVRSAGCSRSADVQNADTHPPVAAGVRNDGPKGRPSQTAHTRPTVAKTARNGEHGVRNATRSLERHHQATPAYRHRHRHRQERCTRRPRRSQMKKTAPQAPTRPPHTGTDAVRKGERKNRDAGQITETAPPSPAHPDRRRRAQAPQTPSRTGTDAERWTWGRDVAKSPEPHSKHPHAHPHRHGRGQERRARKPRRRPGHGNRTAKPRTPRSTPTGSGAGDARRHRHSRSRSRRTVDTNAVTQPEDGNRTPSAHSHRLGRGQERRARSPQRSQVTGTAPPNPAHPDQRRRGSGAVDAHPHRLGRRTADVGPRRCQVTGTALQAPRRHLHRHGRGQERRARKPRRRPGHGNRTAGPTRPALTRTRSRAAGATAETKPGDGNRNNRPRKPRPTPTLSRATDAKAVAQPGHGNCTTTRADGGRSREALPHRLGRGGRDEARWREPRSTPPDARPHRRHALENGGRKTETQPDDGNHIPNPGPARPARTPRRRERWTQNRGAARRWEPHSQPRVRPSRTGGNGEREGGVAASSGCGWAPRAVGDGSGVVGAEAAA